MSPGNSPTRTVLIVDDEALIRWSLSERLTRAGYRTLEAADGRSALRYFALGDSEIDMVLLDLRLPDTDGLTVLRQIKQRCPRCQVMIITAYGTAEAAEEAMQIGALLLTSKPFDIDMILRLVDGAMAQAPQASAS